MNRFATLLVLAAGLAMPISAIAQTPAAADDKEKKTFTQQVAESIKLADKFASSIVVVQYTVQYDKSDSPGTDYFAGDDEEGASRNNSIVWERYIREERPFEHPGYVIGDGLILTADSGLHPRFIKSITVKLGDQTSAATQIAHASNKDSVMLKLDKPLAGAKPLVFDTSKPGPYQAVAASFRDGEWGIGVSAVGARVVKTPGRTLVGGTRNEAIIIDKEGTPVGITMDGRLSADDSWKGSPEKWSLVSQSEMAKALADLEKNAGASVLRCTVNFRSPRGGEGMGGRSRFRSGGDDDDASTEWHGSAIVLDANTALVLGSYKPKTTARLEAVTLFSADGKSTKAKFAGTLKDYGAMLVTLDQPIGTPAKLPTKSIRASLDSLVMRAEISVLGETRTAYYWHDRVTNLIQGWRGQLYPGIEAHGGARGGQNFIFSSDGTLLAIPLPKREKVAVQDGRGGWEDWSVLPVEYLASVLSNRSTAIDPENKPLTADEENRLAWLGVELQAMDPDLARANGVVDQTSGGMTGALVSFVYADSPAGKAGIEVGDIMLRLHIKDQPKPLDVTAGESFPAGAIEQIWANIDRIPDEWFDSFPGPWGPSETPLTRALTDVGFGTPFTAEVFRNGKVLSKDFKIEASPPYYNSAKRVKNEETGITVRDLTYEVRRFFLMQADEPGVIVSKVEKGGKASVAGVKAFERITHVNDQPVKNTDEFVKAVAAGGDLRLSVKKMTEGRIVKLKLGDKKGEEKKPDPNAPADVKPDEKK